MLTKNAAEIGRKRLSNPNGIKASTIPNINAMVNA
jgi:hypothetical protein